MKLTILKRDDGVPYGFVVDISLSRLCKTVAEVPGVRFTDKRRFFWSSEDFHAEFVFREYAYSVDPDPWEAGYWIVPKDKDATHPEIEEIRQHIETRLGCQQELGLPFIFRSCLYGLFVWMGTFYLLTSTLLSARICGSYTNLFLHELVQLFRQAFTLDEELIVLTCLTLWAVCWGLALATLHQPKTKRLKTWPPFVLASASFLLLIIGNNARHFFDGYMAVVFHFAFSVAVVAGIGLPMYMWLQPNTKR